MTPLFGKGIPQEVQSHDLGEGVFCGRKGESTGLGALMFEKSCLQFLQALYFTVTQSAHDMKLAELLSNDIQGPADVMPAGVWLVG